MFAKVFDDKSYINKAFTDFLFDDGVQFITAVSSNRKNKYLSLACIVILANSLIQKALLVFV